MGGLAPQMPTATSQTTVNVQVNSFGQDEAKRLLAMFSPKPVEAITVGPEAVPPIADEPQTPDGA
jgi:hypothetical protein